jgi:enterochelin esterase family protein
VGAAALTEEGTGPSPIVRDDGVTFSLPDEDDALVSVSLLQELQRPRVGPAFIRDEKDATWRLTFPRPAVDRMEYKLELRHRSGEHEVICDPGNPKRAPGVFGDKSVIEFAEYAPPGWIGDSHADHETVDLNLRSVVLRAECNVKLWATPGVEGAAPLPLLVAHDGPEYASLAGLLHFLGVMHERGEVPPMRVALLPPIRRNEEYSASAAYSRALAHEILPAIQQVAPAPRGRNMRIGMGASLGALAMFHVHRSNPASFGALFLQSGSFFRQRFDKQEAQFPRFGRINRFVGTVLSTSDWMHPIPVAMTCGAVEENLHNNLALREALVAQGYDVGFIENRDAHNWVGWRDAFEPALSDLLRMMWS